MRSAFKDASELRVVVVVVVGSSGGDLQCSA